ncbi:MAG: hypothetical protein M1825_006249 [Sarcosagium campestre]|nr:MAG: hypothetical protein M1825_006249 [Sarcosagium campestre]
MIPTTFAALSAVAVAANAFLVVPASVADSTTKVSISPFNTVFNPNSLDIKLSCPSCPRLEKAEADESALVLDFSIDETSRVLSVNNVPVYPPSAMLPQEMKAVQVESDTSLVQVHANKGSAGSPLQKVSLGYEVLVLPVKSLASTRLMSLEFKVLSVEGNAAEEMDMVQLSFLELPDKTLQLVRILAKANPKNNASPSEQGKVGEAKECTGPSLLCKWRSIMASKIASMKGKLRKGCHKSRPHFRPGTMMHPHGPKTHESFAGHDNHHAKPSRSKFMTVIKRIGLQAIVPVFIGIAAGMTASLVGMVVGHLIVLLWRKFFRGNRTGAYTLVDEAEDVTDEKSVVEEEKGLLREEDLPEYEEATTVVVVTDAKE